MKTKLKVINKIKLKIKKQFNIMKTNNNKIKNNFSKIKKSKSFNQKNNYNF